jgi:hypothetical protein
MRHIALIGRSFSGSTIVSYALGALPGAATIGESHWIVDADPSQPEAYCTRCGRECAVLTLDRLRTFRKDRSSWYPRLAEALGTNVLVSSDKTFEFLDVYDPGADYDMLVLFKSPDRHAESYGRAARAKNVEPNFKWYLNTWAEAYKEAIDRASPDRIRFLLLDDFLADPAGVLRSASEWMGVDFDDKAVRYWEHPHHAIGGNFSPWTRILTSPEKMPIHPADHREEVESRVLDAIGGTSAWDVFEAMIGDERRLKSASF